MPEPCTNLDSDGASPEVSEELDGHTFLERAREALLIGAPVSHQLKPRYRVRRMRELHRKPSDYGKTLAAQGEQCAICKTLIGEDTAVIDHSHETGRFRALLCRKCNSGLGFFDDDPQRLRNAARYVAKHRGFWRHFLKALPRELLEAVRRAAQKGR